MSNARFSILQSRAVKDKRISDAQFRTLAALGMYANEDGWCYPSLSTLGVDLGKSKQAVGRDTIALRKLGYLEVTNRYDKKTNSRHSNLYRLVFDLPVNATAIPRQHSVDAPSPSEVDAPSPSEVDVNVPINDPFNFNVNERTALLVKLYSNNIALVNPIASEFLKDAAATYTDATWYEDAFKLAVENNARKWNYVEKILRNWKDNGRDWKPAKHYKAGAYQPKPKLDIDAILGVVR